MFSDWLNANFVRNTASPGVCVNLFTYKSDAHDGGEVWAGQVCVLEVEALEPLGTWLCKQL